MSTIALTSAVTRYSRQGLERENQSGGCVAAPDGVSGEHDGQPDGRHHPADRHSSPALDARSAVGRHFATPNPVFLMFLDLHI
jgi:hypothetical protein